MNIKYFAVGLFLLVAGCTGVTTEVTSPSPPLKSPEELDVGRAINARGFYLTDLGNINYQAPPACGNYELQSHRGSIRYPENSISSVIGSLDNGFDVVEIDVQLTRDDVWVVHHDSYTGRETGTVDNKRRKISSTSYKREWGYLRKRDQHTGELLDFLPPTFIDLAKAFKTSAQSNQKLNIEIKANANTSDLQMLDYLAFSILGEGKYFYSSLKLDALARMRDINPDVYLFYIQGPAKQSIDVLSKKLKSAVQSDNIYQNNQEEVDEIVGFGVRHYRENRFDNDKGMKVLQTKLQRNYGFVMDIRQYAAEPSRIKSLLKRYGLPAATYTINDHGFHAGLLYQLGAGLRPDSVIIDDTIYGFCSQYGVPPVKPYQAVTEVGRRLSMLPPDLDLARISELNAYYDNGLYPRINGQIGAIGASAGVVVEQYANPYKPVILEGDVGPKTSDAKADLTIDKPITVELRQ